MQVKENSFYLTKKGEHTGPLKYWSRAGYFTSLKLPDKRWNSQGRELDETHGLYDSMFEPNDIVQEISSEEKEIHKVFQFHRQT